MRWMTRVSLCALLAAGAGCMRFQPAAVPAPDASGWRGIGHARVVTVTSDYYVLRDVQVTADSVVGWQAARGTEPGQMQRVALHRNQIRRFEQKRLAVVRSGLLALVAGYVAAVAISIRGTDW